jgi:plastocyanin
VVAFAADRAAAPKTVEVLVDGTTYAPASVTVHRGQRVTWVNRDPFPHTVTARGAFDSGDIAAGSKWSYTPAKAGRWDYICTLHPNMRGTIVVE